MSYPHRESRRAELQKLRAEVVKELERLNFRSENIHSALAKMTQHAEGTIRRLLTASRRSASARNALARCGSDSPGRVLTHCMNAMSRGFSMAVAAKAQLEAV
jgi:hypothetical protein